MNGYAKASFENTYVAGNCLVLVLINTHQFIEGGIPPFVFSLAPN